MSASMEVMPPNGHETMLEAVFNKIKSILPNDEKVKQTPTTASASYRILLSSDADDTEHTDKVFKNTNLRYYPEASSLSISNNGEITLGGYTSDPDASFSWLTSEHLSVEDYWTSHSALRLTATDLEFPRLIIEGTEYNNTWDGTHSSLKDTITYLASQSAVNKVDYIHSTDASEYTIDTLANTDSLAVMGVTLSGTPTANHGAFLNVKNVGTPFQLFMPDNVRYIYKRYRNNSTGAYYDWFKLDAGYSDTSGTSNYSNYTGIQRVNKDSRYKPGTNTLVVEEFQNNSANLPNANWYHIYTSEGSDSNYAVQLALGMTVDGAYYRKCANNSWGGWIDLMRPSWGNVSGKPTVIEANGTNKTVTAGTVLGAASLTIPSSGVYLLTYMCIFPSGQANWQTCGGLISTTNGGSGPINDAALCNYRYGYNQETRCHGTTMATLNANTVIYMNLWGRGTGALAGCAGHIRAIRLY